MPFNPISDRYFLIGLYAPLAVSITISEPPTLTMFLSNLVTPFISCGWFTLSKSEKSNLSPFFGSYTAYSPGVNFDFFPLLCVM